MDKTTPLFGLLIDNSDVATQEYFPVNDSISGAVVHSAPASSVEQSIQAVESAEKALESWRDSTPLERRTIFYRAAEIMKGRKEELVQAMMLETGATPSWAAFNIDTGLQFIQEGAGMATQVKGELLSSNQKGTTAMIFKEPCGVILGIAPWNATIILAIRAFITPLVCGNTVVLKASESSPYTQYLVVDCFHKAGLPAGVLNFVCCPRERAGAITEAMIAHSAVAKVNFTGSTAVGRIIGNLAAKYLKPVVLELGGKAPLIVLQDANLEEAVKAAAFGAMFHQGQICMSTERVIIHKSVSAKFHQLFKAKIDSLYAANPVSDPSAPLGSLINPASGARVHSLVSNALQHGAKVSGGKFSISGSMAQPIALSGITKEMNLYYEESFGPVVCLFEFETIDEAVHLANDTQYGLVASIYSADVFGALKVARRIRSGTCHINGPTVHDEPHLPIGGQKASGYGKFGGSACIDEFTEDRVVTFRGGEEHHYPL